MPARIHDPVGHPAHQILAKANLRVHRACRCQHIACHHIAQMRRHGGRANINRHPDNRLFEPWPDCTDMMPIAQRHRDLPVASAQNGLQLLQNMQITGNLATNPVWPLRDKRLGKTAEIAGWFMHIRFAHFDKAQPA